MSSLNDFSKKPFPKYATAAKELEQPNPSFPFPTSGGCVRVHVCNYLHKSRPQLLFCSSKTEPNNLVLPSFLHSID